MKTGKKSVDLATDARVSRIRRDPPAVSKKVVVRDPTDNERLEAFIGIVAFTIALFIILLGFWVYYF